MIFDLLFDKAWKCEREKYRKKKTMKNMLGCLQKHCWSLMLSCYGNGCEKNGRWKGEDSEMKNKRMNIWAFVTWFRR